VTGEEAAFMPSKYSIEIEEVLESGVVPMGYDNVEESDDPRIKIAESALKNLGK